MNGKVTIYTLAEELGVSVSAVSRAFNPDSRLNAEKRKKILSAATKYGFSPNRAAARLSRREIRIGVIIVNRIPEFYQPMHEGIMAGARELASQKVTADVRMLLPGEGVKDEYIRSLKDFEAQRYDGVIVHGSYGEDIVMLVNELADEGIPVATLHNDLPASKRLFNSTSNTAATGAMAAELLNLFIRGERKNVILFTGSMSSIIHQQLFMSFSSACAREGLTLVRSYDTMDVPAFAERLVEEAFTARGDIDGVYVSSANSLPVCEYLEAHGLGEKVKLVTSDVFGKLSEYVRRGVVDATIYQDPFRQGKNAFVHLFLYIAENVEPPKVLMSNPQIVIRSNLGMFEGG